MNNLIASNLKEARVAVSINNRKLARLVATKDMAYDQCTQWHFVKLTLGNIPNTHQGGFSVASGCPFMVTSNMPFQKWPLGALSHWPSSHDAPPFYGHHSVLFDGH